MSQVEFVGLNVTPHIPDGFLDVHIVQHKEHKAGLPQRLPRPDTNTMQKS